MSSHCSFDERKVMGLGNSDSRNAIAGVDKYRYEQEIESEGERYREDFTRIKVVCLQHLSSSPVRGALCSACGAPATIPHGTAHASRFLPTHGRFGYRLLPYTCQSRLCARSSAPVSIQTIIGNKDTALCHAQYTCHTRVLCRRV